MTSKDRFTTPYKVFLGQLCRPFAYLAIRHEHKKIMDWFFPGILVGLSAIVLLAWGEKINLYGSSGVLSKILSFIQNLPGFYIAALAAIATFGRSDIDSIIPAPTPLITEFRGGEEQEVALTRRRFLSMMFAFLTAECVIIILGSIGLLTLAGDLDKSSIPYASTIGAAAFLLIMLFFFQMILTTFWGLYYLGDKVHKVD
ncbi:hypothetical protein [Pseudomonas putida]|uniref:Uncharacterized protein n=1 Tax=Pseudomonas putida TaxID=303 RepID=A0A7V8EIT0_PSEPU|nr:hypothetical protein [Pseudomonas putida]KAF0255608.1 hypothetical protein GN299_07520 [Pseudomonas putida]